MDRTEVLKRVIDAYNHPTVNDVPQYEQFFVRFGLLYGTAWEKLSIEEKDKAKSGNFQGCFSLAVSLDDVIVDDEFEFTPYVCGYMLGLMESIETFSTDLIEN